MGQRVKMYKASFGNAEVHYFEKCWNSKSLKLKLGQVHCSRHRRDLQIAFHVHCAFTYAPWRGAAEICVPCRGLCSKAGQSFSETDLGGVHGPSTFKGSVDCCSAFRICTAFCCRALHYRVLVFHFQGSVKQDFLFLQHSFVVSTSYVRLFRFSHPSYSLQFDLSQLCFVLFVFSDLFHLFLPQKRNLLRFCVVVETSVVVCSLSLWRSLMEIVRWEAADTTAQHERVSATSSRGGYCFSAAIFCCAEDEYQSGKSAGVCVSYCSYRSFSLAQSEYNAGL